MTCATASRVSLSRFSSNTTSLPSTSTPSRSRFPVSVGVLTPHQSQARHQHLRVPDQQLLQRLLGFHPIGRLHRFGSVRRSVDLPHPEFVVHFPVLHSPVLVRRLLHARLALTPTLAHIGARIPDLGQLVRRSAYGGSSDRVEIPTPRECAMRLYDVSPTSPTQREFHRFSFFSATQVIELLNPCS